MDKITFIKLENCFQDFYSGDPEPKIIRSDEVDHIRTAMECDWSNSDLKYFDHSLLNDVYFEFTLKDGTPFRCYGDVNEFISCLNGKKHIVKNIFNLFMFIVKDV